MNYKRGLTCIPPEVEKALPLDIISILKKDGHGLSFPDKTLVQMRHICDGVNYGSSYSYSQHGGIRKAVETAMSKKKQLEVVYPKIVKNGHVTFYRKYDKRRCKVEYGYQVSYKKDKKTKTRKFSFGYVEPSPDKQLHGFVTAKYFRFLYETQGSDFDPDLFKNWKNVRLYTPKKEHYNWGCI